MLPLAIGGVEQGLKLNHPDVGFMDAMKATLPFLRVSTIGLMLLLFGNLLFALNIFGLAFVWEKALVKKVFAAVTAPLETVRLRFASARPRGGAGMKNGALIFLAAFIALGGSWCGFVLAPQLQLGGMKQTTILNSSDVYPVGRTGGANLGLQAYRANGCAACHTQQVRQDGVACDVILVERR